MTESNHYQNEIEHFNQLAHQWWDPQGTMATLHAINPTRLNYILQTTSLHKKNIIDIGCGGGILSEALANKGAHVTGIDLSEQAINIAKQHAQEHNLTINYQIKSAESLVNSHQQQFDIVTCMELLEHVPSPEKIIASAQKLCKPGGYIFFSTINRNLQAYLKVILAGEYILNIIPKNTHNYQQLIRPSELAAWCRKNKLTIKNISGLHLNPITKQCKLTNNTQCNYLLTCQK